MTTPSHKQHYRLSPSAAALYVGPEGEVIVQLSDFFIRVQDGITPGGFPAVPLAYIVANFANLGTFNGLVSSFNSLNSSLEAVAFSGSYTDLINKPVISAVGGSGQWVDILGKPSFATVATSGSYVDLSSKPTISAVGASGQWADILSKPAFAAVATSGAYSDLSGRPSLAAVALSGAYSDLSGKPILGNISGINYTISSSGPSGGSNGDLWFRF